MDDGVADERFVGALRGVYFEDLIHAGLLQCGQAARQGEREFDFELRDVGVGALGHVGVGDLGDQVGAEVVEVVLRAGGHAEFRGEFEDLAGEGLEAVGQRRRLRLFALAGGRRAVCDPGELLFGAVGGVDHEFRAFDDRVDLAEVGGYSRHLLGQVVGRDRQRRWCRG